MSWQLPWSAGVAGGAGQVVSLDLQSGINLMGVTIESLVVGAGSVGDVHLTMVVGSLSWIWRGDPTRISRSRRSPSEAM